jgi:hypothetical protein
MEHEALILKRHGAPTKFDTMIKGTICEVNLINGSLEVYRQMNEDENDPRWELIENYDSKVE